MHTSKSILRKPAIHRFSNVRCRIIPTTTTLFATANFSLRNRPPRPCAKSGVLHRPLHTERRWGKVGLVGQRRFDLTRGNVEQQPTTLSIGRESAAVRLFDTPPTTLMDLRFADETTFNAVITAHTLSQALNGRILLAGGLACASLAGSLYRTHADADFLVAQADFPTIRSFFRERLTHQGTNVARARVLAGFGEKRSMSALQMLIAGKDESHVTVDFLVYTQREGRTLLQCGNYPDILLEEFPYPIPPVPGRLLGLFVYTAPLAVLRRMKEKGARRNEKDRLDFARLPQPI